MDSDTKSEFAEVNVEDVAPGDNTTRARNRTVMLTPEMTGTMRARLGGEALGEVFEPRGMLNESEVAVSTEWGESESEAVSGTVFSGYTDASEDPQGVRGWESNDPVESFEPESPRVIDEEIAPADVAESFESPQWEEPRSAINEQSHIIAPARIVRTSSAAREAHGQMRGVESAHGQMGGSSIAGAAYVPEDVDHSHDRSQVSPSSGRMVSEAEVETLKHDRIFWKSPSQLVGFLVSYDYDPSGSYVELRKGRLLITSETDASGNCLIVDHDTVSPMHAVMRIADGGAVQVLDQLSEYGTRVVRGEGSQDAGEEVLLSGDKASVRNGDILSFGDRKFHVCLVTAA
jgi:hypothetical protein